MYIYYEVHTKAANKCEHTPTPHADALRIAPIYSPDVLVRVLVRAGTKQQCTRFVAAPKATTGVIPVHDSLPDKGLMLLHHVLREDPDRPRYFEVMESLGLQYTSMKAMQADTGVPMHPEMDDLKVGAASAYRSLGCGHQAVSVQNGGVRLVPETYQPCKRSDYCSAANDRCRDPRVKVGASYVVVCDVASIMREYGFHGQDRPRRGGLRASSSGCVPTKWLTNHTGVLDGRSRLVDGNASRARGGFCRWLLQNWSILLFGPARRPFACRDPDLPLKPYGYGISCSCW
jgi:hypothetical protein